MLFARGIVVAVMIAACISSWSHCLPNAKMARLVRGHPTARLQTEGAEEPEWDPQQEDQSDATVGKDIADYNLDIDYEGSEPKAKPVTQDKSKVNPDAEYANIEIPWDGTFCQRMMPKDIYMGIL